MKMNHYDIVFVGQLGMGTIVPFRGSPFVEPGGPALFASIGASCLGKRIATVTRISENDGYPLEPLKSAGIDVFVLPGEIGMGGQDGAQLNKSAHDRDVDLNSAWAVQDARKHRNPLLRKGIRAVLGVLSPS